MLNKNIKNLVCVGFGLQNGSKSIVCLFDLVGFPTNQHSVGHIAPKKSLKGLLNV